MKTHEQFQEIVSQALKELGADQRAVPGAKLRAHVSLLAGDEFQEFLSGRSLTFSEFLTTITGVEVHKRIGTDMLVGLKGAAIPIAGPSSSRDTRDAPRLRADVYASLTEVRQDPYYYLPDSDQFIADKPEGKTVVALPRVTFEELLDERREFARAIEDEGRREALLKAVDWSPNPLGQFRNAISSLGLGKAWYTYKSRLLRDKLTKWAEDNKLEVQATWFSHAGESLESPQDILADLARYMTDDEIRGLLVPFRAVEAVYRAPRRRRG